MRRAAALAGGAADIGRSSTLPLVTGHAKGIPFTVIAPGGMCQAKAPGAGSSSRASDIATEAWIDAHGGDSTRVQYVELPDASVMAALENPFGDDVSALGAHLPQTAWFCTGDYASKSPEVVRRFAQVLRDAGIHTNAHHAETVDLLAAFANMEPATIARMTRAEQAPYLDPRDIQPLIDAAYRYKVIDKRFDAAEIISPLALKSR